MATYRGIVEGLQSERRAKSAEKIRAEYEAGLKRQRAKADQAAEE